MSKVSIKSVVKKYDENNLKLVSHDNPYSASYNEAKRKKPSKLSSYFIILVESGTIEYSLDLKSVSVSEGQLLFALPNQVFIPPLTDKGIKYYKIIFDERTLSLLPNQFQFLINPLNIQTINLDVPSRNRLAILFEILKGLLTSKEQQTDIEITLAYLNSLLTEINSAYFKNEPQTAGLNANFSKFIDFKLMVETKLTEQPSIKAFAEDLALSTNSLYRIVKEYSGQSPKDFLKNRLMMEAKRRLQYSNLSVKELAFELGFNDPDYFSRFFKKCTGKSISDFIDNKGDL